MKLTKAQANAIYQRFGFDNEYDYLRECEEGEVSERKMSRINAAFEAARHDSPQVSDPQANDLSSEVETMRPQPQPMPRSIAPTAKEQPESIMIEGAGEITPSIWEKYGKRRVYFNTQARKSIACYDLLKGEWVENNTDSVKADIKAAFPQFFPTEDPVVEPRVG